ncbi:MAG: DUF1553 domain-containing protein [Planctomycetota bacterium]
MSKSRRLVQLVFALSLLPLSWGWAQEGTTRVDFKTEIRPILSNRCFACHGPDENTVEAGLRLDTRERATQALESSNVAVVPGDLSQSEVVRRILSDDEDIRMPPPHFGQRLTDHEIDLIKRWVTQGAEYAMHWSFEPPVLPVIPMVEPDEPALLPWNHGPIDRLVLAKLAEKDWTPSPRADALTLLRRVTLDLTGLPPTLEEQQAFLREPSSDAYERVVDTLLASPAYGEHWGRRWLDLARYADSAGYADDPMRTIWGYRDWVIRAHNENMPFDQFTLEQLAGDMLPDPTPEQLVATAFHRNTLTNNEGGTNDEEFRNVAIVDRVNTTMSVWMGMTMACAQCHNHKYDPISQKDYFQVFAIFNQSEDADRRDESPVYDWFSADHRALRERLQRELESIEKAIVTPDPNLVAEQQAWEKQFREPITWSSVVPTSGRTKSGGALNIDETGLVRAVTPADTDDYTLEFDLPAAMKLEDIRGLRIRSVPQSDLPHGGAGFGDGNFVLTDVSLSALDPDEASASMGRFLRIELPGPERILSLAEVQIFSKGENIALKGAATQSSESYAGSAPRAVDGNTSGNYAQNSVTHTKATENPWWEVDLGAEFPAETVAVWNRTDGDVGSRLAGAKLSLLRSDRSEVWRETLQTAQVENRWSVQRIDAWKASRSRADHEQPGFAASQAIDSDAKTGWAVGGSIDQPHTLDLSGAFASAPSESTASANRVLRLKLAFQSKHAGLLLASFRIDVSSDARSDAMLAIPVDVLNRIRTNDRTVEDEEAIHRHYISTVAPSRDPLRKERDALQRALDGIKPITTVPVMRDLPVEKRRETRIQLRGNYRVTGDTVSPNIPEIFRSHGSDIGENPSRLELAQWLVSNRNPLTARVIANRMWEYLFGVGIVRSSEEFGSQGDLPVNGALLDYLAIDLMQSNWDLKRFLRSIVLSETYKQSSSVDRKRFEEDPENIFVSRGPRLRVAAEQVRDMALSAAGLLSNRLYGPPTRPQQPTMGLKAAFGSKTDWDTSKGEDRYRRAIYTQWRRSNPYPSMATFDAPNREVCVLKRDRTNTPLQALVMLNDPVYIEAAQGLARRVVNHELPDGLDEQRIERIFQHAISRKPNSRETAALVQLLQESRTEYTGKVDQAKQFASDPIGPLPASVSPVEMAAWTTLCNIVLNLDEFLMTP